MKILMREVLEAVDMMDAALLALERLKARHPDDYKEIRRIGEGLSFAGGLLGGFLSIEFDVGLAEGDLETVGGGYADEDPDLDGAVGAVRSVRPIRRRADATGKRHIGFVP